MLMYFGWKQRPLACFQLFLDDDDNDIKKNMIDVRKHSGTKLIKIISMQSVIVLINNIVTLTFGVRCWICNHSIN